MDDDYLVDEGALPSELSPQVAAAVCTLLTHWILGLSARPGITGKAARAIALNRDDLHSLVVAARALRRDDPVAALPAVNEIARAARSRLIAKGGRP